MRILTRLIRAVVRAAVNSGKKPERKPVRRSLDSGPSTKFIADMKALAATAPPGSIQIMQGAGRKYVPDSYTIKTLDEPDAAVYGGVFISAEVFIEGVKYGFHAYPHARAERGEMGWLYYSVTGPGNADFKRGEFEITYDFRWTGARPLNPLLVKHVLRKWVAQPEVKLAVERARKALPVPKWKRKARSKDTSHSS